MVTLEKTCSGTYNSMQESANAIDNTSKQRERHNVNTLSAPPVGSSFLIPGLRLPMPGSLKAKRKVQVI